MYVRQVSHTPKATVDRLSAGAMIGVIFVGTGPGSQPKVFRRQLNFSNLAFRLAKCDFLA